MLLVIGTFNKLRTRLGAFSRSPGTVQLREGSLTALDAGTLWPSPPSLSSPGDLIRGGHTTSGHLAPGTSRRMGKLPQQHLRVTLSSTHPQFTFCLQAPLSNLKLEFTFRVVSQPLNKIVKLVPRYQKLLSGMLCGSAVCSVGMDSSLSCELCVSVRSLCSQI